MYIGLIGLGRMGLNIGLHVLAALRREFGGHAVSHAQEPTKPLQPN